jgi:hypothetical protein
LPGYGRSRAATGAHTIDLAGTPGKSGRPNVEVGCHHQAVIASIEAMEAKIGKRFYRGLLKRVARAWTPKQIQDEVVLLKVLAQMQGAERVLARLEAAQARLTPETVQKVVSSLNAPPAKLEDLQGLHMLVVALERAAETGDLPCLALTQENDYYDHNKRGGH